MTPNDAKGRGSAGAEAGVGGMCRQVLWGGAGAGGRQPAEDPEERPVTTGAAGHCGGESSRRRQIGQQFKRRFWEPDEEISGGRSWTHQEIGQIIHPSHGFNGSKGVLVGHYLDFGKTMSVLPTNVSGWRSSRAPVSTRNTRRSSRRRSLYRGLACHGAAVHGGRNRTRRMKRSSRSANPTVGCTSLAITGQT
jgi:hypothetical protein